MVTTRAQSKSSTTSHKTNSEQTRASPSPHRISKPAKPQKQRKAPKSAQAPIRQPVSADRFGLIQERYQHSLYALLIQAILWNQTPGRAARPVLETILERYPDPQTLSAVPFDELEELLHPIGLSRQRAARLIKLAQVWLDAPPCKERRYVRRHYPNKGNGREAKVGETLSEDDEREGWEIAHLPGMGPYAIDSYRMFYRDTLRDIDVKGGAEPEWKRVKAGDKDLRAWLVWAWGREGLEYDVHTGATTKKEP